VQNVSSSNLPSKNIKVTIYRAIILPIVLYWLWSLVSHNAGGTLAEGVWQQGAKENIWVWEWEVEKTAEQRALWSVFHSDYYSGDHIKKNEMGEACGMHSR